MKKRSLVYGLAMSLFVSLIFLLSLSLSSYHRIIGMEEAGFMSLGQVLEGLENSQARIQVLEAKTRENKEKKYILVNQVGDPLYANLDMEDLPSYISWEELQALDKSQEKTSLQILERSWREGMAQSIYALDSGGYLVQIDQQESLVAYILSNLPISLVIFIIGSFLNTLILERLFDKKKRQAQFLVRNLGGLVEDPSLDLPLDPDFKEAGLMAKEEAQKIQDQIQRMESQLSGLKDMIVNMREGVILVGEDRKIISINQSAVKIVNASIYINYMDKDILYLCRELDFIRIFNKAFEEALPGIETMEIGGRTIKIFLNPVFTAENIFFGMMLLLIDVTEASRAEKQRREFTSNVTHELKTPLTSIRGYAELLQTGLVQEEDQKKFLAIILEESQRLFELIDAIISMSRLEEDIQEGEMELLDLKGLVESILRSREPDIKAKDLHIQTHFSKDNRLYTHPRLMEEILRNLLDNAISYNVKGGTIAITIKDAEDELVFSIKDTGIGIAYDHQDHIFERFYMVDQSRSYNKKSTGLGLSITKHNVDKLKGRIDLVSQKGKGSLFTVTLPKTQKSQ
ncbi:MAG: HAMP domain-containing sensor histidine kinase [Tissierellia bacterium]|nr:HAMP domain-containing sensor histidine kinase [Tissierellia bacterium]